jgi:ADP-ribose pyrophosphatase YjhB (NUDIX family)
MAATLRATEVRITAGSGMRLPYEVFVFVRCQGEFLILRRSERQGGYWHCVAGAVEEGETYAEAAVRELREETGLAARFRPLAGALDGVPAGLLGYEEHPAGTKGLHMNFVFVAEVAADAEVTPNEEFDAWRWVNRAELGALASPLNVRQFGYLALDAVWE